MARLTKEQKELLSKQNATCVEELSDYIWDIIQQMNDYETLYFDVNRFLFDRYMERQR